MAILQIKGIDDALYARLRRMAAADHRSISQEVLHLIEEYLTREARKPVTATSARALLALAGSWDSVMRHHHGYRLHRQLQGQPRSL